MGARTLVRDLAYRTVVLSGAARRARARGGAAVFCFHDVVPDLATAARGERSLHVPAADFDRYADWMAATYDVVPVPDLVARLRAGRPTAGLAAITFDDACVGVFAHAAPALARRGLPWTVFVVSGASARPEPYWWDRMAAAGLLDERTRERCLTSLRGDAEQVLAEYPAAAAADVPPEFFAAPWETIRASGAHVGAHTVTHRNLAALDVDSLQRELERGAAEIADAFGARPATLAYPYGLASDAVLAAARAAGYEAGFTMVSGTVAPGADLLALPRVNVPGGITLDALDCRAAGVRLRGT